MGKVFGTCGCEIVEGLGHVVDIKTLSKENQPAISTLTLCELCYEWYNNQGYILKTTQDKERWLK